MLVTNCGKRPTRGLDGYSLVTRHCQQRKLPDQVASDADSPHFLGGNTLAYSGIGANRGSANKGTADAGAGGIQPSHHLVSWTDFLLDRRPLIS
jgi:hypothetical protein